ncbi:SDR family NAD(P)-dependent oxidoreductase [Aureibacter tunicatorum]|uniref:Nucleoside-diphosphate-sugar epimerase n=1 Tax=Aureibacter tunicatorum TaxID=866807 RepID=A0AAE3XTV4_9BACT|nr:SDR family NAD(P)-dependent oxidoreductase [Aureibacter tunicatorum]MDR6241594.1 nucleoside-diphosphate-sugar epimerase [Aureibacter tunicatorum]BDD07182.1 hypothetical protein AUTU_46650 [Aureibacter tunicatorum]
MTTNQNQNLSVFITGANGGLGFETAKILLASGVGRLALATRKEAKAVQARARILDQVRAKGKVEAYGGFDMNDPKSIEDSVKRMPENKPFNVIFLQAGGVFFTDDYQFLNYGKKRLEKTVFQNAFGAYITLVNLQKAGLVAPNARVVFAGGEGARGIPGMIEKPVFLSYNSLKGYIEGSKDMPAYNPMNSIGISKLVSALISQKLSEINDGNEYIWFTPGLTHGTNGLKKVAPVKRFFMEKVMFGMSAMLGMSQSPKKGAEKYAECLLGEVGKNGDVLGAPEGKVLGKITDQKPMNPSIRDRDLIDGIWRMVNEIYPRTA